MRAIISQRLVPTREGGRAAALEIMLDAPRIKELLKRGETDVPKDAMEQSVLEGCQTFDGAIFQLYAAGRITEEAAIAAADSPNNLRIRLDRFRASGGASAAIDRPKLRLLLAEG